MLIFNHQSTTHTTYTSCLMARIHFVKPEWHRIHCWVCTAELFIQLGQNSEYYHLSPIRATVCTQLNVYVTDSLAALSIVLLTPYPLLTLLPVIEPLGSCQLLQNLEKYAISLPTLTPQCPTKSRYPVRSDTDSGQEGRTGGKGIQERREGGPKWTTLSIVREGGSEGGREGVYRRL